MEDRDLAHLIDLRGEVVQIHEEIYARIRKCFHAILVVTSRINVVDTDSIRTQLFHERCIKRALCVVDERVVGSQLVRNT